METQMNKQSPDRTIPMHGTPERLRKKQYRHLFASFVMMMLFTIIAFLAVGSEAIADQFAVPLILVLATIQVAMQLFIFMHLNEKGSGYFIVFMFSGFFAAILTLVALGLLIWWP